MIEWGVLCRLGQDSWSVVHREYTPCHDGLFVLSSRSVRPRQHFDLYTQPNSEVSIDSVAVTSDGLLQDHKHNQLNLLAVV
jgi:hypothetical protein